MTETTDTGSALSRANLALGLGVAALLAYVIAIFANGDGDKYGWLWVVSAALGLGALVAGFIARQGGRPPARAIVGMVLGGLILVVFVLFVTGVLS
jgi:hypothetical protein